MSRIFARSASSTLARKLGLHPLGSTRLLLVCPRASPKAYHPLLAYAFKLWGCRWRSDFIHQAPWWFDISIFVKELKGRFAQWYNRRHGRDSQWRRLDREGSALSSGIKALPCKINVS